jgi:hypothetical protein
MQIAHFNVGGKSFSGQLIKKGAHTFRVGWPIKSVPKQLAKFAQPSATRPGLSTIKLTVACLERVEKNGPGGEIILTPETVLGDE